MYQPDKHQSVSNKFSSFSHNFQELNKFVRDALFSTPSIRIRFCCIMKGFRTSPKTDLRLPTWIPKSTKK